MIHKFDSWDWSDIPVQHYKDEPGTWMSVTRRLLSPEANAQFEVRYFEVAPGGYTSHEMHVHEHCVVVLRGEGRVKLNQDWHNLASLDVVRVAGETPHQFENTGSEPFGILCIVDKERDRPILLDPQGNPETSDT